jgi:biotin transport system substrate-specific component
MLAGLAIIFMFGITWLALVASTASGSAAVGWSAALASGLYPFLVADVVKLAVASGLVPAIWRAIGRTQ